MHGQETEVKFYVGNLAKIETKLIELGAHLIQPRVHETNLRFDTSERTLRNEGKVLRLRHDESSKMTFKSGATAHNGILSRKEIEFGVESFEAARALIESLGYEVMVFYEKYRMTYELAGLHIMLDELPYGDFVEIEGDAFDGIRKLADQLGLDFSRAIETSYHALFERIAERKNLNAGSLSFETFRNWKPNAEELSVSKADIKE